MPTGGGVWGNNIVLATIQLQGLAPGQTLLIASDSNPPDLTEGFAIDPALGGGFADVVYNDGLAIVPEPSVAGLLLLVALATCLRRRANEH